MNDQILDDFRTEEEIPISLWKYRVVGVCRLFMVFFLTASVIGNIMRTISFLNGSSLASSSSETGTLGSLLGFVLSILAWIYHSGQVLVELRERQGFADKRRFRGASIGFNILLVFALFIWLFNSLLSTSLSKILSISNIALFLSTGVLIILLLADFRYTRASKR